MKGFFSESELTIVQAPPSMIPKCGVCGLYKKCKSPKMSPSGDGRKKILIVGETPGIEEDEKGLHLVSKSGQMLQAVLRKYGVDMRRDCVLTNSLICKPAGGDISDVRMIDYCRPNLLKTIEDMQPNLIITLGGTAASSLIDYVWGDSSGGVERMSGWSIPCQKYNCWICPTYHPAFVLRSSDKNSLMQMKFESHIETALKLAADRPWPDGKVPDYRSEVECIQETDRAASILRKMRERGGTVAFDYETNMLKPDSDKARIYSCAFSWEGRKTIAFPWHGEAKREALEVLWDADIAKIGYNLKFEERWTRALYKRGIRNWKIDGMVASHVDDNRKAVTSLKFQAFVLLGQNCYNAHIEPYLKPDVKGGNNVNRIAEISMPDLLAYNGMDALLEFHVGKIFMKRLGIE